MAIQKERTIHVRMYCMATSSGIDAYEDQEDAGQMISSSGLVHQWQSVFNVHVTRDRNRSSALVSVSATSDPQS